MERSNLGAISQQIIDSLTSHIALYHASIPYASTTSANPRDAVLRWFASLSIQQRQSYLTVFDMNFVKILMQMQSHICKKGNGLFIVLPDLPSTENPSLPSLCFRKCHGLLSRAHFMNDTKRSISRAVRFFGSEEERAATDYPSIELLDSFTVSEEFVQDFDQFVDTMDMVSNGMFLRSEEHMSDSYWEELPWLKAKGYYSIDEFVANKIELALRISWFSQHSGKKRGVKLKGKACASGIATNLFRRKRGCIDWWIGLDHGARKKIFTMFLSKSAKYLVNGIIKSENHELNGEIQFLDVPKEQRRCGGCGSSSSMAIPGFSKTYIKFEFDTLFPLIYGKCTSLLYAYNRIFVIREITSLILAYEYDKFDMEKLFFSSFQSLFSILDCILRSLRGFLMMVSCSYITLELLTDKIDTSTTNKPKKKSDASPLKGKTKGRIKRRPSIQSKFVLDNHSEGERHCLTNKEDNTSTYEPLQSTLPVCTNLKNKSSNCGNPEKHPFQDQTILLNNKEQATRKNNRKARSKGKCLFLKEKVAADYSKSISGSIAPPYEPTVNLQESNASVGNCVPLPSTFETDHSFGKFVEEENAKQILDDVDIPITHYSCTDTILVNSDTLPCESSPSKEEDFLNTSINSDITNIDKEMSNAKMVDGRCSTSNRNASMFLLDSDDTTCHTVLSRLDPENAFNVSYLATEHNSGCSSTVSQPVFEVIDYPKSGEHLFSYHEKKTAGRRGLDDPSLMRFKSYEWPNFTPIIFSPANSDNIPAATDRLHLEIGSNHNRSCHSVGLATCQVRNASDGRWRQFVPSLTSSASRFSPNQPFVCENEFISRFPSSNSSFTYHNMQLNGTNSEDENKNPLDIVDFGNLRNWSDLGEDVESHWVFEDDSEVHAISDRDYNQLFGGGVMYWNSSDFAGSGFSRPPSLSSEDSSWAWYEAELNRTVDDIVGVTGVSPYNTNGVASPSTSSFCSPFDPSGTSHHSLGYVMPGKETTVKSQTILDVSDDKHDVCSIKLYHSANESTVNDSFTYPILRPIVVSNMSRKGSRSEFKVSHEYKSPGMHITKRDNPQVKRPPSPVVLCVPRAPRAPRPPPPSPAGESRKHRGLPAVRSGSSSPRHIGLRNWCHDGTNFEDTSIFMDGTDVIWPSWGNKGLSANSIVHPISGNLVQDCMITLSQFAHDQEHVNPDAAFPLQPQELLNCPIRKATLSLLHSLLHEEIDSFCKQVAAKNLNKKYCINWAVKKVERSLQVLWPRSRTNIFGSNVTGLALPTSDVDLVVCLPPVRNLEPIKEAGILEGRNGIKETCLQHAARYLANQDWVKNDSLKIIENTAIPIIMLIAEVPEDISSCSENSSLMSEKKCNSTNSEVLESEKHSGSACTRIKYQKTDESALVRLDISFKSPSHTGLETTELVQKLTGQFPASIPLALVLKQFLADRNLDHSYSGGLSSYCLVLLITRFLQHQHHLGRSINQNLGSLLMDFLYFFGNVFDPRQMRVSIQGSGLYVKRERGQSIDPIHIDDPLYPTNNVGKNCFRIHQCIKAFAEAYSFLESALTSLSPSDDVSARPSVRLLPKIVPSIDAS